MVSVGNDLITGTMGFVGIIFNDFKPYIILIIGIFLGFWIIEELVDIVENNLASRKETAERLAGLKEAEEKKIFAPYHAREKELEIGEIRESLFQED